MEFSPTIKHLIAGTVGGLISTVTLYPLELVKTRMQVIDDESAYRSLPRAFRLIIRNEGLAGLYQGMAPALLAASGSWGGYFYVYEMSKARKVAAITSSGSEKLSTVDHLLSGIEAGVVLVFTFNPFWVVKTRLAVQGAEKSIESTQKYRGMADALVTIVREEGVAGLYKGLLPALLLTSHGAIQFAAYESLKSAMEGYVGDQQSTRSKSGQYKQPAWVSVLLGGVSKIVASTATYPYQLIKSRLQQRDAFNPNTQKFEQRYNSTWDCARKVWRAEGFHGFFRGVLPSVLKVAPQSAVTFLVYEETLKLLRATE